MKTNVHKIDKWGKFGSFLYQLRYTVIITLVVLAIALGIFAPKLPGVLGGDGFQTKGDYQTTKAILDKDFKQSQDTLLLVFQKNKGISKEDFQKRIEDITTRIQTKETYDSFHHPLENKEMLQDDIAYATILFSGKTSKERNEKTLQFAKEIEKESNDTLKVSPTGFPKINEEINERTQNDLKVAEMIGLPIAFLVLLFSFGSLLASILPILNGALSVISTMGILYFIGVDKELSIFVLNVAPMIGLALSIDFALLFVNRFREEVAYRTVKEAIAVTYQTAGRAIVFSGLCVFVGLSGLFFFEIDYIQSVAISGMIVVIMSMLFSLTLLPALLSLIGKRILKRDQTAPRTSNMWRKFAQFVMKHPIMMIIVVTLFIIVCLLPLRTANLQFPGVEALPEKSDTRIAYERYEESFNKIVKTHADVTLVLEMKSNVIEKENLQKLEDVIQKLKKDKHVYKVKSLYDELNGMKPEQLATLLQSPQRTQVEPVLEAYTKGNKTTLQISLDTKPRTETAKQWVRDFKDTYKDDSITYYLGGMTTFQQELEDEIKDKVVVGMSVIFGSTFFILLFAFRSILIPIKAIVMNVLSLSATIGIVIWLFEGGHFGLEESSVLFVLPIFIFGLVFGLSMDYEVFLISRIHELYEETGDNDTATLEGLVSTSRIITSAALIMIVVTGAFAFTDILPVKQMGLGVALAIFLDATIIRLMLVPSLMKMFGDWNWWLPFRKKKVKSSD
ncbi:MMPL family transporter [Bacillus pseudomycoides]|uniref:MMPL family transporter n=1 Tax=Bacillus pseudomycoides TaxID=64104 RepID=A0AAJ2DL07_9BACI|nr:MMPL family transporter [Bacillus pseudomycoides]KFN13024.1 MMPL family protein [Bacillus pseudomycoides]MDR4186279.1 MMPL family transporter [Bacillus pseudomycoides]MDR4324883.1 MMPL family transporter [Bacillus pseudomycoides]MED0856966.1 MMPL family transporter [Bacillus pseudomycoides]MED1535092.1 MMPL family transporter [Bacillus pseudomycoides]